ncbi:MAG: PKD domain-containing protein [Thermoplasmatales archaeon]|nr:PKD domain-containing protein [Thermoplasmatales archaeon]
MSNKKKTDGLKKGLIVSLIGAVVLMSVLFASLMQAETTVQGVDRVPTYAGGIDKDGNFGGVLVMNMTITNGTGNPATLTIDWINITFYNVSGFNASTHFETLTGTTASGVALYYDMINDGWQSDSDVLVSTTTPVYNEIENDTTGGEWRYDFANPALGSNIGTRYVYVVVRLTSTATSGDEFNVSIGQNQIVGHDTGGTTYWDPDTAIYTDTITIDVDKPVAVTNVYVNNYPISENKWTNTNSFFVNWTGITNPGSNSPIKEYRYLIDTLPDKWNDGISVGGNLNKTVSVSGDNNHTMYIWAVDEALNMGDRAYAYLLYDTTPPQDLSITIYDLDSPYNETWTNNLGVKLKVYATDGVTGNVSGLYAFYASNDNFVSHSECLETNPSGTGPWFYTTYSLPSGADGTKTVWFKAVDKTVEGNEATPVNDAIILDMTNPSITVQHTVYPAGQTFATDGNNVTLNATIVDVTSGINYVTVNATYINATAGWINMTRIAGTDYWVTDNITVNITPSDGVFNLYINATDNATNQEPTVYIECRVDNTDPTVTNITTDYPGDQTAAHNTQTMTLRVNVTDSGAVNYPNVKVNVTNITGIPDDWRNMTLDDDGTSTNTAGNWSLVDVVVSSSLNATTNLPVHVGDDLGNWENGTTVAVKIDNVIPSVTNPDKVYDTDSPPTYVGTIGWARNGDNITLNVTVTDAIAGVWTVKVNATLLNASAGWVTMYDDGAHDDGAADDGNYAAWVIVSGATNDTKYLDVVATDYAGLQNTSVNITVNVDNAPLVYPQTTQYPDNPIADANWSQDGDTVNITVNVVDQPMPDNINFVRVFITSNVNASLAGQWIDLEYYGSNIWYNKSVVIESASDGIHSLYVNVSDKSGNYNNTTVVQVNVDNTAPSVTVNDVTYPVNQTQAKDTDTVTLNVTVTDAGVHLVQVNVTNITGVANDWKTMSRVTGTNFYTVDVVVNIGTTGPKYCPVRAYDNASNLNNAENITVNVDNIKPTVTNAGYACVSNTTYVTNLTTEPDFSVNNSENLVLNVTVTDADSGILYNSTGNYWYIMVDVSEINGTNVWREMTNNTAGGTNFTYTVGIDETITDGYKYLYINATDNATNKNTTTIKVWIVGVPPKLGGPYAWYPEENPLTTAAATPGHIMTINVTVDNSSGCHVNWTSGVMIDVGEITTGPGTHNWTAMYDDGTHGDGAAGDGNFTVNITVGSNILSSPSEGYNLTINATDIAGRSSDNRAGSINWVLVKVDKDNPIVSANPTTYVTGGAANYNEIVILNVTVTDSPAGVYKVWVNVSAINNTGTLLREMNHMAGTNYYTLSVEVNYTTRPGQGYHYLPVRAEDNVGHWYNETTVIVQIDIGGPSVTVYVTAQTSGGNATIPMAIVGDWINITVYTDTDVNETGVTVALSAFNNATGQSLGTKTMTFLAVVGGQHKYYYNFTLYSTQAAAVNNITNYPFQANAIDSQGNPGIGTNSTLELDACLPHSTVKAISADAYWNATELSAVNGINVSWEPSDIVVGDDAGVAFSYDVYRKVGHAGDWVLWLDDTTDLYACFMDVSGMEGTTFYFYSVAKDWAGNVENSYYLTYNLTPMYNSTDVAVGANSTDSITGTLTSYDSGSGAATDGNTSTYRSFVYAADGSAYLELTFVNAPAEGYVIDYIIINCSGTTGSFNYNVTYWDGSAWVKIVDKTGATANTSVPYGDIYRSDGLLVKATKIRIHGTYYSGGTAFNISEVKVYGLADGDTNTILDTIAPLFTFYQINAVGNLSSSPTEYTRDNTVDLTVQASDVTSSPDHVFLSNNGTVWYDAGAYDGSWLHYSWDLIATAYGGVNIDGWKTVYINITDNAGNWRVVSTSHILLDRLDPINLSIVINNGETSTASTTVTLALSAAENGTVNVSGLYQMRFKDVLYNEWTAWMAYNTSYTFTLRAGDGQREIKFEVNDKAWNNATSVSDYIFLNQNLPTIAHGFVAGGTVGGYDSNGNPWYTSNITVYINATDTQKIESLLYKVHYENGSWYPASGWNTTNYSGVNWINVTIYLNGTEGIFEIYFYAVNNASNTNTSYQTIPWYIRIDKTKPITTLTTTPVTAHENWYNSNVTVYLVSVDNITNAANVSGVNWTTYHIYNETTGEWGYYNATYVWTTGWVTYNATTGILLPYEGNYTIECNATDYAALSNYPTNFTLQYIRIDKTKPVPTLTLNTNHNATGTNTTAITLNISATDTDSGIINSGLYQMCFFDNNGIWTTWENYSANLSYAWVLSTGDGLKLVYFKVRDNALNEEIISRNTTLDTTPPELSIIDALAAYQTVADFNVNWSGSDAGVGLKPAPYTIEYQRNNGTGWSNWTVWLSDTGAGPVLWHGIDGTKYRFRCIATDKVDNVQNRSLAAYVEVLIDLTSPTIGAILINSGAEYTNILTVTISLTNAADPSQFYPSGLKDVGLSNDGSTWTWKTYPYNTDSVSWDLASGDGTKTVYVMVRDNASHESANVTNTIKLDQTAPTTSHNIVSGIVGENGWYTSEVNISISASDTGTLPSGVVSITYILDGTPTTVSGTTAWFIIPADGVHTVQYYATDLSGNIETTHPSPALNISVDKTKPTTPNAPTDIGEWSTIASMTWTWTASTDVTSDIAGYYISIGTTSLANEVLVDHDVGLPSVLKYSWAGAEGVTYYAKIKAYDAAGNIGIYSGASDGITIDTVAPIANAPVDEGKWSTDTTLTWTWTPSTDATSDVAGYYVYVGTTLGTALSGYPVWVTVATYQTSTGIDDGKTYYAWIQAKDNAGNNGSYSGYSDGITVDATPPASSMAALPTYTTSTSFTVSWYSSNLDVASYKLEYKYTGIDWAPLYTGTGLSYSFTPATDGTYYFRSIATDQAGNPEVKTTYDTYTTVDTVKPTVTPTITGTLGSNGWYTNATTVTLTPSETATIYYYWDTATEAEYTAALAASEDEHTLYYRAIDLAGNEKSGSKIVKVDTGLPTSSVATLATYQTSLTSFSVSWSGSDATSGIATYTIQYKDGATGTWTDWKTDTIETSGTYVGTEGYTYYFRSKAKDKAGNVETAFTDTGDTYTTVDTVKPTVTPTITGTLGSNGWYVSAATVTLTPSETATIYYYWDTATEAEYTAALAASEGEHTLYYRAVDLAGNEKSGSTVVKIDTTDPTITASLSGTSGENDYYTSKVTVTLTASDATSGVATREYNIGTGWIDYTVPFDITTDGTYTLQYRVTDNAGNTKVGTSVTVKIDKTAPTALSISIAAGAEYTKSASVTLILDATGAAQLLVSNDQATWLEYNASWTLSTGDGTKTVYLKAVDNAGNYAIKSATILLDTTDPTALASANKYTIYKGETVLFNGAASSDTNGIATYEWDVDNDGVTDYTTANPSHTYAETGTYTVTLKVTDNAGNTKAASIEITVNKKPEPPIPGFEVLALIAAMGVAVILLRKKH